MAMSTPINRGQKLFVWSYENNILINWVATTCNLRENKCEMLTYLSWIISSERTCEIESNKITVTVLYKMNHTDLQEYILNIPTYFKISKVSLWKCDQKITLNTKCEFWKLKKIIFISCKCQAIVTNVIMICYNWNTIRTPSLLLSWLHLFSSHYKVSQQSQLLNSCHGLPCTCTVGHCTVDLLWFAEQGLACSIHNLLYTDMVRLALLWCICHIKMDNGMSVINL